MKRITIIAIGALALLCPKDAMCETLMYKLTMKLKVPRIYDNMQSLGSRKVQSQTVCGYVYVDKDNLDESGEPAVFVRDVFNKTHKVGGANVTYRDSDATDVMYRYIGNNKTGAFKKPCCKFSLDLDPSYNIGYDEPDNTLVIQLSGQGSSDKRIRGSITGQIGCGCKAYGHVSPTRTVDRRVNDIAPLYGSFTMALVQTRK